MSFSKYAFGVVSGGIGIAIGHAFACLPVAIHKAYEVGEISDWFKAWIFFVFVLGLPALLLIKIPVALCFYLICFNIKVNHISTCLRRSYFVAMSLAFASGFFGALKSSSIVVGLISSLSLVFYFVVIIETARFVRKNLDEL
jgi:hypothetical protein